MENVADHIIYNVTVKVDKGIAEQWLQWLMDEHISDIMATGCFYRYQLVKLLESDEREGPTYAIQYYASSRSDYNRYIEIHAETFRKKSADKWGDRFIAFRSLLQIVQ